MHVTGSNPQIHIRKGLIMTTAGGFLYTLDLPLLRLSMSDLWTMVFARGLFLFLSLTALWLLNRWWRGGRQPFVDGPEGLAVVITIALSSICYVNAVAATYAANVVFISALIPLITAVFSAVFIGERVRLVTWLATLVALAGVAAIVWSSVKGGQWYGDFMALLASIYTAATFTIFRSCSRNLSSSIAVGSLVSSLVALVFFGATPLALFHPASYGLPAWVWLGLNGLVAIPLASLLFANGPRYMPSTDVSMFFLLETVFTPLWVWHLFGEVPDWAVLTGGAVVVVTLVLHSIWRMTARPAKPLMRRPSLQSAE